MRRRPRWWAVTALMVAAVAIVGGIAVAVGPRDDAKTEAQRRFEELQRVRQAGRDRDNAPMDSGPTGWYLPADRSDGWSVTSVEVVEPEPATRVRTPADDPERPCACESVTWVSPDGNRGITATMQPGNDISIVTDQYGRSLTTKPMAFDWVKGVVGRVPSAEGDDHDADLRVLIVSDGTRVLQVAGEARDQGTMAQMATAWVQNGLPELVGDIGEPEGWTLHSLGAARLESDEPFVRVSLDTPDGPATYDLVPTGTRPFLPGASLGVLPEIGPAFVDATSGATVIAGQGADIVIASAVGADDGPTADVVGSALAGALRPVSAEGWAAALADVDHDDVLDQPALARTSQLVATGGSPATSRKAATRRGWGDNVDGLELSVDLWATDVVEGEPVGAHVLVRNTTERPITLNECNEAAFQWGLLRPGQTHHRLAYRGFTDCYDTLRYEIPPGSTLRYPTDQGLPTTQPPWSLTFDDDPEFGTGTFRAVVQLGGSRSSIRSVDPRTVTVHKRTCPPLPEAFRTLDPDTGPQVQSYADAGAAAKQAGLTIRLLKVGDDPGPVDCGRITAYTDTGGLTAFTRS